MLWNNRTSYSQLKPKYWNRYLSMKTDYVHKYCRKIHKKKKSAKKGIL
jgi:hypothetical protein